MGQGVLPHGELDEGRMLDKLEQNPQKGNHVKQEGIKDLIEEFFRKELKKGYMVPIALHYVRRLRGAEVCPVLVT